MEPNLCKGWQGKKKTANAETDHRKKTRKLPLRGWSCPSLCCWRMQRWGTAAAPRFHVLLATPAAD